MSRVDPDYWFQPPEDRREVARRHLARIGLSLDDSDGAKLAGVEPIRIETYGPPVPAHIVDPHSFFRPPGSMPISALLADMLGYKPPAIISGASNDGAKSDTPDDELASIEGMRRG